MAKPLLLPILLLLSSCSCNWHLSKLEQKCGKFKTDTLTVHDTLVTLEVRKDTVFKYFQRDTVIVREGKLTMKYFYRQHDSTVYLQGKCDPDTVIREIRVPYEKASVTVDYFPKWLVWAAIAVFGAALIYKVVIK